MTEHPMTSRRRVRWAVLASIATVLAVVLVAVTPSLNWWSGDDGPSEAELEEAVAVEARIERLDSLAYGTWEQHSAGAYLDYLANTAKVDQCMAAEGERFGYPFIDPFAGRPVK